MQCLFIFIIVIHIDSDNWAEDFLAHRFVFRVFGKDYRRLDEPTLALVARTAKHDFGIGALLGMFDITHAVVERGLVDNGIDESTKVAHIAHLDFFQHLAHDALHLGPQTGRNIGTAGCRALLSLELESTTHDGCSHLVGIGTLMGKDKVLAARLTDNLRIGAIVGDIVAYRLPEAVEGASGAGEVDTTEVLVGKCHLANQRAATGQEVDNAVGKTGLFVNLHQQEVGEHGGGAGFPDTHVTH